MKHKVKISLATPPDGGGIVHCRRVGIRERLMGWLLGERRNVMVIVPGDSVRTLAVEEEAEGWYGDS